MRYRLRTLLIVVTACGALCGLARWWNTPFVHLRRNVLTNGALTEDWLFKREFPNGAVQIGLVQYYSNGNKAMEIRYGDHSFHYLAGYPRYWLDDGTEVSREEYERAIHLLMR